MLKDGRAAFAITATLGDDDPSYLEWHRRLQDALGQNGDTIKGSVNMLTTIRELKQLVSNRKR